MLNLLRRVEDTLVQIVRVVLLAFSVFVLIGMGLWIWDHYKSKKPDAALAAPVALNWKDAPYDLKYMEEETGRDLSSINPQIPLEKRLADPALRSSFQKADGLLRGLIYKDPAARKRIEKENSGQGLDPIHPLLKGDAAPSDDEVNRQIKMREARENSCCDKEAADAAAAAADAAWSARRIALNREDRAAAAAVSAAVAAAAEAEASDEDVPLSDPVNLAAEIHSRAQAAEQEHGEGSYAAYVKGLPAALEKVLANEKLTAKLQLQPAQQIVNILLTNYTLSFDRTAQMLRGENPDEDKWKFLGVDTAFATMLISCLVMVVMVLVLIRMERHMRTMSQNSTPKS
ncbi:hypothetical protein [Comamonas guangdongensis]|uniref:Uncharacterized protein n=1 Tax=Comamonas guangdongensis TaxID=510515 RepID=A0ABV3ZU93_9BURK